MACAAFQRLRSYGPIFNTWQIDEAIATRDERVANGGVTIGFNFFTVGTK
jgi:hypothetical protein